jgi:DNA-binding NarL/FixJ family response regulator
MEREAAALGAAGMVLKSGGFSVLYERVRQVLPPSDSAM